MRYNGQDIFSMDSAGRQRLRQEIQYIFQDPYASLDPRKTVAFSIAEPIRTHGLLSDEAAIARRVGELLEQVGLKPEHAARYPHEFSAASASACASRARWPATPSSSSPTNRCRRWTCRSRRRS